MKVKKKGVIYIRDYDMLFKDSSDVTDFFLLFMSALTPNNFRTAGSLNMCIFLLLCYSCCQIQTRDSWVRSANSCSVLCRYPIRCHKSLLLQWPKHVIHPMPLKGSLRQVVGVRDAFLPDSTRFLNRKPSKPWRSGRGSPVRHLRPPWRTRALGTCGGCPSGSPSRLETPSWSGCGTSPRSPPKLIEDNLIFVQKMQMPHNWTLRALVGKIGIGTKAEHGCSQDVNRPNIFKLSQHFFCWTSLVS